MKQTKPSLQRMLLAAALALPLLQAAAASADEAPPPGSPGMRGPGPDMRAAGPGPGHGMREMDGRHGFGAGGPMGGPFGGPMGGPPGAPDGAAPPFLRGIDLTEAQQDKVFAILHGQIPLLREQQKLLTKARKDLYQLAASSQYDDGRAAALAQSAAQAMARISLIYARSEQQVLALLTPEQRKQAESGLNGEPRRAPRPQQ